MKNMKILLACSAGMSTSLLERNCYAYLKEKGLDYKVSAMGSTPAKAVVADYDVILIGPQVRYMLEEFKELSKGKPVAVIPMQVYGLMNGPETIKLAEATYKAAHNE